MSHIWVPRAKILELKDPLGFGTRMQGFYKIDAVKADGRRRVLADWFPNLITDVGLNQIGTNSNWAAKCFVGSGTNAPNVLDTGLQTLVAESNTLTSAFGAQAVEPYFGWGRQVFRFNEGVAAGNLSEVGVGSAGGVTMFSRALILDGVGNPTTITVLSDEFLDVTYEIRVYPPLVDVLGTITISAIDYGFTLRSAFVTNGTNWHDGGGAFTGGGFPNNGVTLYGGAGLALGAITAGPTSVGSSQSFNTAQDAYVPGSLERGFSIDVPLNLANFTPGITGLIFTVGNGRRGTFQVAIDTPIPKDATKLLSLDFKHTWARAVI